MWIQNEKSVFFSKGYIDFPDTDNKKKRSKLDSEDKVALNIKYLFIFNQYF